MRTCLSLFAAVALAGTLSAQTATNVWGIYPESTDATSRSGLGGPQTGDLLVESRGLSWESTNFHGGASGADFIGLGDQQMFSTGGGIPGTGGRLSGFRVNIQDQNASTVEGFDFVIVAEDAAALGNPMTPPAGNPVGPGVLLRTVTLTPPAGPSTGAAWQITATLATAADVLPPQAAGSTPPGALSSTYYYGCGLPPNAAWTADGQSIHMASFYGLGGTFPNSGDNPRDGQTSLTQTRDVTIGAVNGRSSTAPRTHAIWLLSEAIVAQSGANITPVAQVGPDPNFGMAGSYNDACGTSTLRATTYGSSSRGGIGDGYTLRARDANTPAGSPAAVFLSASGASPSGFSPFPIYLGFTRGAIQVDLAALVPVGPFVTSATGTVTLSSGAAANALCAATGLRLSAQVITVDLTLPAINISNGVSTSL